MLLIKNLNKKFGDKEIFKNLSCEFNNFGVTMIVGVNGVGKTTLMNLISGLVKSDSGEISLFGENNTSKKFKEELFYLPSDFYIPEYMTGNEYANFILSKYKNADKSRFINIIEILEMSKDVKKLVEVYSFGMKKKLQIAIALSTNVKYFMMDEVFSGLDFETTVLVEELVNKFSKNSKFIIISHDKNALEKFSEDILLLQNQKLNKHNGNVAALYEKIKVESFINEKISKIK